MNPLRLTSVNLFIAADTGLRPASTNRGLLLCDEGQVVAAFTIGSLTIARRWRCILGRSSPQSRSLDWQRTCAEFQGRSYRKHYGAECLGSIFESLRFRRGSRVPGSRSTFSLAWSLQRPSRELLWPTAQSIFCCAGLWQGLPETPPTSQA
jgi:hypothetical protein